MRREKIVEAAVPIPTWRWMMKTYRTLRNAVYDVTALPPEQKKIYEKVKRFSDKRPHWDRFTGFWVRQMDTLQPALTRKEIVNTPIWKICEDMDSRIAIEQGYARRSDYLDELLDLIESKRRSPRAFCREVGLDEDYLNRVLNKRQPFSLRKLEKVLDALGYELTIREKA
jgi:hypothetical protein